MWLIVTAFCFLIWILLTDLLTQPLWVWGCALSKQRLTEEESKFNKMTNQDIISCLNIPLKRFSPGNLKILNKAKYTAILRDRFLLTRYNIWYVHSKWIFCSSAKWNIINETVTFLSLRFAFILFCFSALWTELSTSCSPMGKISMTFFVDTH